MDIPSRINYSIVCSSDFLYFGTNFMAARNIKPPSCSKYRMAPIVLSICTIVGDDKQRGERPKMQNPDLTKWLEMVWEALNEHDELKRDHLLHVADAFLQRDTQDPASALPFLDGEITAA